MIKLLVKKFIKNYDDVKNQNVREKYYKSVFQMIKCG